MAEEKETKKKAPAKKAASAKSSSKSTAAKKTPAKKAESAEAKKPAAEKKTAAKPAAKKEAAKAKKPAGKTIRVTQTGSPIGRQDIQRRTLIGLGLNKMHRTRELEDTPAVRGMIAKVSHLVRVDEAA